MVLSRPTGLEEAEYDIVEPVLLSKKIKKYSKDVILITISAIVFVTVVAVYAVFSTIITNYYTERRAKESKKQKTKDKNSDTLISNLIFAIFTILSAIILVPLLLSFIVK